MTQAPATPELVERLKDAAERFLKWTYDQPYSGSPVISIPRHPNNIDAILCEAAAALEAQQARIAELEAERDEARDIVAWCNNSLFGSHGYFTAASGKTASEAIEDLKAGSHEQWRRAEASQALADRYEKLLREAAALFRFYETSHLAKKTQDGDEKAYRNAEIAGRIEAALSSQGRHEGGEG